MNNNKKYDELIGKRIAEIRKSRNVTQTELGTYIGKSKETINGYEHGRNSLTASCLIQILKYLDYDVDTFVKEINF